MKTTLSLFAFLFLSVATAVDHPVQIYTPEGVETQAVEDLPRLREVEEGVWRSGRPTEKGLVQLQQNVGLRTIINIDDSASAGKKEEAWANKLGITYYSMPMSAFSRPNDAQVDQILALLNDQSLYPILIHCKHGEDRTGMMVGLRRVFYSLWTPKDAYKEMLDLGFHTILFNLDKYFKDRTGYQPLH